MKTLIQTLFFFLLATQVCLTQWYRQSPIPYLGNPNDVCFADANTGTIVGGGWNNATSQYEAMILRTTDGGETWISQSAGTARWLDGVCFTDANNGTAVGGDGVILRTTDGGNNWTSYSSGYYNGLIDVCFTDATNGTVVGYGWIGGNSGGIILKTTDGGNSWSSQIVDVQNLYGVSFINANTGTVVGVGSNNEAIILRTTDGGIN